MEHSNPTYVSGSDSSTSSSGERLAVPPASYVSPATLYEAFLSIPFSPLAPQPKIPEVAGPPKAALAGPPSARERDQSSEEEEEDEGPASGLDEQEFMALTGIKEDADWLVMRKNQGKLLKAIKAGKMVVLCTICLANQERCMMPTTTGAVREHMNAHTEGKIWTYACKYADEGCETSMGRIDNLRAHEKKCRSQPEAQ
ncbi:hypothetical protein JCM1840_005063 [Sporobolomyces johnsonii]